MSERSALCFNTNTLLWTLSSIRPGKAASVQRTLKDLQEEKCKETGSGSRLLHTTVPVVDVNMASWGWRVYSNPCDPRLLRQFFFYFWKESVFLLFILVPSLLQPHLVLGRLPKAGQPEKTAFAEGVFKGGGPNTACLHWRASPQLSVTVVSPP